MSLRFFLALALIFQATNGIINRKSLAGPPEEFGSHEIPDPSKSASYSQAALLPVTFTKALQGNYSWESAIEVDSSTYFAFTVYSPVATKVTLLDKNHKPIDISKLGTAEMTEILGTKVPTTTYEITKPQPGTYYLHLDSAVKAVEQSEVVPDAYVVVMNQSPLELVSYVNTFHLVVGNQVGLVAQVMQGSQLVGGENSKNLGSVSSANLDIIYPDGQEVVIPMKDNGLNGDLVASDGAYLATFITSAPGYYTVQASVTGTDAQGHAFVRTAEHVFSVSPIATAFTGQATIQAMNTQQMVPIQIGLTNAVSSSVRVYAEMYGATSSNKLQAICWIGGLADVQVVNGKASVTILVDVEWFGTKNTQAPYTLRNVILQDVDSWSVVASAPVVVTTATEFKFMPSLQFGHRITERMRQGPRPVSLNARSNQSDASPIVLLHGYCSLYNPFQQSAADFTNPKFFLNSKSSLGHDAYAKLLIDWAADLGSYAVIGHSQGGIVATHIKNYYWSGMDQLTGTGRQIQSVASPYQGNSAAGVIARIGKLFGIGCGTNSDLTVVGSTLWLSGISAVTRSNVHFYTATYKTSAFIDWCNLAMNLVLRGYNDGIAESVYTPLPGANNEGNDQSWCHSDGMKYPPIYLDHQRNQIMNALAQRVTTLASTGHISTTANSATTVVLSFGFITICLATLLI